MSEGIKCINIVIGKQSYMLLGDWVLVAISSTDW